VQSAFGDRHPPLQPPTNDRRRKLRNDNPPPPPIEMFLRVESDSPFVVAPERRFYCGQSGHGTLSGVAASDPSPRRLPFPPPFCAPTVSAQTLLTPAGVVSFFPTPFPSPLSWRDRGHPRSSSVVSRFLRSRCTFTHARFVLAMRSRATPLASLAWSEHETLRPRPFIAQGGFTDRPGGQALFFNLSGSSAA